MWRCAPAGGSVPGLSEAGQTLAQLKPTRPGGVAVGFAVARGSATGAPVPLRRDAELLEDIERAMYGRASFELLRTRIRPSRKECGSCSPHSVNLLAMAAISLSARRRSSEWAVPTTRTETSSPPTAWASCKRSACSSSVASRPSSTACQSSVSKLWPTPWWWRRCPPVGDVRPVFALQSRIGGEGSPGAWPPVSLHGDIRVAGSGGSQQPIERPLRTLRAGQLTVRVAVLLVRSGSKSKGCSPNSHHEGWMLTVPVAPGTTVSTRRENAKVRWVSGSTQ